MGLAIKDGYVVDHINNDRTDNRRENLRVVTKKMNSRNRKLLKLGFNGLKLERTGRYAVNNIHRKYIGTVDTPEQGAELQDIWCLNQPDFSEEKYPLNFPERKDELSKKNAIQFKKTRTSMYRGVHRMNKKFTAIISFEKKQEILLSSYSEVDCAKAYDDAVVKYQFDRELNFPDRYPNYIPRKIVKTTGIEIAPGVVKLNIKNDKGRTFLVSKEDFDSIIQYCACFVDCTNNYLCLGSPYYTSCHRVLLDVRNPKIFVDHINGDPGDNRRENLRLVTPAQNSRNRLKRSISCKSKFYGVHKSRNSWCCQAQFENKSLFSKCFKSEEDAARWRDLFFIFNPIYEGYPLNFEWTDDDVGLWIVKLDFSDIR